jgi:hypothetical protein
VRHRQVSFGEGRLWNRKPFRVADGGLDSAGSGTAGIRKKLFPSASWRIKHIKRLLVVCGAIVVVIRVE